MREPESPDFDKCKEEIVDLILRGCSETLFDSNSHPLCIE